MEFYFYNPRLNELSDIPSLVAWFREEFDSYGYSSPTIEEGKCDVQGSYVSIDESGLFRSGLYPQTGLEARSLNTAFCTKYIGLPDEFIDKIKDAKSRLRVSLIPDNEEHPQDCADIIAVFSQIKDSCFFGPWEFHQKKMEQFERTVTKNWVLKRLLPVVSPLLTQQGFVEDKLRFERPDGRGLAFEFMTKADCKYNEGNRGSFHVFAFEGWLNRPVPAKDNCILRYIEPDGSNVEEQIAELKEALDPVDEKWWKFD
jgi:hypothetical protein